MTYYTIQYNQQNEPYIIEKNFGHKLHEAEGNSHWTWHITQRGVQHLSKDYFGRPQAMPAYINKEQLEDLKAYNMLRRSDGSLIGKPLYPSEEKIRVQKPSIQPLPIAKKPTGIPVQPVKRPVQPLKRVPPIQPPDAPRQTLQPQKRGFLGWLKSLIGKD